MQSIPFAFEFYGQPVTDFKVSQNGVVTFDTAAAILPGANENLPSTQLPNMSIAMFWDEFTINPPTGSNDVIYTKTFGTAPNRQFWIKYYSFEIGNYQGFAYWGMALEETTNKIYIVDMKYDSGTSTKTVGVQENVSNATQFGNSSLVFGPGSSGNTDNGWYEFTPEQLDGAIITGGGFSGNARVGGTDSPVSQFEIFAYTNSQDFSSMALTYTGSVDPAEISNIKLWNDVNGNGEVDLGESQLGSTVSSLTGGQATFTGSPLLSVVVNTSEHVLVTCDVGSGASGKETVSFEVTGASDVSVAPGPDNSQYPVAGGSSETVEYVATLPYYTDFTGSVEATNQSLESAAGTYPTATGAGTVPASGTTSSNGSTSFSTSAGPGGSVGGSQLVMRAASSSGAAALDSRFDFSGYNEALHDVYLTFGWYDDDLVAPTGDDFNYVFISDDAGATWFTAAYDIDEDANLSNWSNAMVNLSDAFINAGRTFTSDVIIRIQAGGTSSAQGIVVDFVEVREIYEGVSVSAEVPEVTGMGHFHLALEDDMKVLCFSVTPQLTDQVLTGVTVTNSGTMPDGDITSVKLWLDVDYNCAVSPGDVLMGDIVFASGEANFTGFNLPVNLGTTRDFVVTYSFAQNASGTVGCEIADGSDISVSPGQAYAYTSFPEGGVIGPAATVTATLPYLANFDSPPNSNIAVRGKAGSYATASQVGGAVTEANTSNDADIGWWTSRNGINPHQGSVGLASFEFLEGEATAAMDFLFDLSAYSVASDELVFQLAWVDNGLDASNANFDHVFLSNDGGESWITSALFLDPEGQEDVWKESFVDISKVLADAGQDFTSNMVISVQFASNSGFAMVDDVELFVVGPTAPVIDDPEATGGGLAAAGYPEWLYYKFNEGSGTSTLNEAIPGVGDQNPTFSGSPSWITSDPQLGNAALQFGSGSSGQGKIYSGWQPVIPSSQSFTIETWLRTGTSFQYLCGDSTASSWRMYFLGSTGNISMRSGGLSFHDTTSGGLNDNQWHHVAFVYDAAVNESRWYIDGVHDSTMTNQFANINGTDFQVGGYSGTTYYWYGDLDEFRFWSSAQTEQQIQAAYQAELATYPAMEFTGTKPSYSATIEQGGNLDFAISANDINTGDTITFTVSETGGSLTADAAGFDQVFTGGVYNDPNPNSPAPHSIELTGVADALGDIQLTILAQDSAGLTDTVTIDITIVAGDPVVRAVPTELPTMNAYGYGLPSLAEVTTVQGYGLTGDLTITAPSQFEISETAGVGYTNQVILTPVNGSVPRTDIHVRYNPSVQGPHEGEVVASGPGVDIDAKVKVEGFILPQVPPALQDPRSAADPVELLTNRALSAGTGSGYPVNTVWEDVRMESVYLVSELSAAGLKGGTPITEIHYQVAEEPGEDLKNVRIRMRHTGDNTVTDYSTSGLTTVHGPMDHAASGFTEEAWYAFEFDTPFIWNGVENVIVDFSMDGTSFTAGGGVFMRDAGTDRTLTGYDDSGSSYPFNTIANQTQLDSVPAIRMSQGLMISGTDPDFTAVGIVGDELNLEFGATDPNVQETLTFTISDAGGTLTAAQAGINQTFSGGIYADPNPGVSPRTLTLDGTAAAVGTLSLNIQVTDGFFTESQTLNIEIMSAPEISFSGIPMPVFVAPTAGGPSPEQSFTVAGTNLISDVTITVPDGFGISTTSGSGYVSQVVLPETGGALAETTLYVRYDPSAGSTADAGNMLVSTDRLASEKVLLWGVVGDDPVVTTIDTPIPTLFAPAIGTPGDPESFTVLVANPIGPVSVTAPDEFEVSLSQSGGFGSNVTVTPPAGQTQLAMVVFVRYNPAGPGTSANGDITIAASSATPLDVPVEGVVGVDPGDNGGGGGGDSSSDSGCSTGTSDYSKWVLLLGALAMLMLAARLRRARG